MVDRKNRFKILKERRRDTVYDFLIRGDDDFKLSDLWSYIEEVAARSTNYSAVVDSWPSLSYWFRYDKCTDQYYMGAKLSLKSTLISEIKRLTVDDSQDPRVGTQMIRKFVYSIEKSLKE